MARPDAPTPLARRDETALIFTLEFKAYGDSAGVLTSAQADYQGRDFDGTVPKMMPAPEGNMAYTKAEINAMFDDRGVRTEPFMVFGYANDGRVVLKTETPNLGAPYGPTATYGQNPVHWDPEWFVYDEAYDDTWTNAERLSHVVRREETGVFLMDVTNADFRAAMVDYYRRDLNPDNTAKLRVDGVVIDVLGPNNVGFFYSEGGGPFNPFTKYSYVTDNLLLIADVKAASDAAAADRKLPVIPNGLVNGLVYFDDDASAAGTGHTRRILEAADMAWAEMFSRPFHASVTAWPNTATFEADADMLVDAETVLDKGIMASTHLWVNATEAQSIQWCAFSFGQFNLGAGGRCMFSFNDANKNGPHRPLDYPVDPAGTPSSGRRRQFQTPQFYPSLGRCFDRVKLGLPVTDDYTKNKNGLTSLYWREFTNGEVWVNNHATTTRNVTIAGTGADTYVEFKSATELAGGTVQAVLPHNSLILTKVSSGGGGGAYSADAATGVTETDATLHASTTDPTADTGVVFYLSDGSAWHVEGAGPSWSWNMPPGHPLQPDTDYSYYVVFLDTATGDQTSTNTATFTTDPDTTAPTWVDATPRGTASPGRIVVDDFLAYDLAGVVRYVITRTGGGTVIFEIGQSDAPFLADTTVAPTTSYTYDIQAFDAAGNASSTIQVIVMSAAASDANSGPFLGPLRS